MYLIEFTNKALKDTVEIERAKLKDKVAGIIETVSRNPFEPSQHFEKIVGSQNPHIYTRRINLRHRFVYTIEPNTERHKDPRGVPYDGIVVIHRIWGHFPQ